VSGPVDDGVVRARTEVAAARLLADHGFGAQAVSRAYYAAFYAAEAALLHVGETRTKHAGVVSAVGRVLVREGNLDERAGRLLRSLFERRSQADYGLAGVPDDEARRAVDDAETVVDAIEAWLQTPPPATSSR
jgi:uncharacterized protein (UPF0332 family)